MPALWQVKKNLTTVNLYIIFSQRFFDKGTQEIRM